MQNSQWAFVWFLSLDYYEIKSIKSILDLTNKFPLFELIVNGCRHSVQRIKRSRKRGHKKDYEKNECEIIGKFYQTLFFCRVDNLFVRISLRENYEYNISFFWCWKRKLSYIFTQLSLRSTFLKLFDFLYIYDPLINLEVFCS